MLLQLCAEAKDYQLNYLKSSSLIWELSFILLCKMIAMWSMEHKKLQDLQKTDKTFRNYYTDLNAAYHE